MFKFCQILTTIKQLLSNLEFSVHKFHTSFQISSKHGIRQFTRMVNEEMATNSYNCQHVHTMLLNLHLIVKIIQMMNLLDLWDWTTEMLEQL